MEELEAKYLVINDSHYFCPTSNNGGLGSQMFSYKMIEALDVTLTPSSKWLNDNLRKKSIIFCKKLKFYKVILFIKKFK